MIEPQQLDELMRALSHNERRAFIVACRGQARSAGELAALSSLSPAAISEHLKVLRKTGLLVLEKRGRSWLYQTDTAAVAAVVQAMQALVAP
ncbi:metalloregulator ArsR/SmtB family transcription factor [Devosia sp.]|uniref:ArsR/SmtB family transcription factor n=1 Tax=Devosia sp. TaxID=1871048 RepID=UPI003265EBD3